MRLLWLTAALVPVASAQTWSSAPSDTTRWAAVSDSLGQRVYVDAERLEPVAGVVEVWTWHAFAEPRRPRGGDPYDRVMALDRVFCRLRATAPVHRARSLAGVGGRSFLYPADTGPFGWAPGSLAEAVGERVCREASPPATDE